MEKHINLYSFILEYLNPSLIDTDLVAISDAKSHIEEAFIHKECLVNISKEEDLRELSRYEIDFAKNVSYVYAVFIKAKQIGRIYFIKSKNPDFDFTCTLWTDNEKHDELLYKQIKEYVASYNYRIAFIPFEITDKEFGYEY